MAYKRFKKLDGKMHDRKLKSIIGMSLPKFNTLHAAFAAAYDAVQQERCQQGEINQVPTGGPKDHLDMLEKKLFFIFYYLKTYPTFDVLGFHSEFSSGHAHDHMENLLQSLSDLDVLGRSPEMPEEFAQLVEKYSDIALD